MSAESTNPTKKSLQRQKTMAQIIDGAIAVFREKGFENANIVDITRASDVAIGSLNNCFGNKERLGAYVTLTMLKHTMPPVHATVGFEENPELFALAAVTTYHRFMMETGGYRQFFIDSLKYDFIFNYLSKRPNPHAMNLVRHYYGGDIDEETAALKALYMPYMLGRTLILKQQEGYFSGISISEIALLICREALKDRVPEEALRGLMPRSTRIAAEVCEALADRPSMQTIESVVRMEI